MDFVENVQDFTALLKTESEWLNSVSGFTLTDACKTALKEFCFKKASGFVLVKVFAIKKLIKALISGGLIPPIKVKFDYFTAGHSYLLDKGEIHFCKDFLFKDSYEKNVAMALHEIAHAVLLKQSGYKALLSLNAEFLDIIKTPSQIVITPVEFFANVLTSMMLERVAQGEKHTERVAFLKEEADFLKRKMRASIKNL